MTITFRALGALLGYPTPALLEALQMLEMTVPGHAAGLGLSGARRERATDEQQFGVLGHHLDAVGLTIAVGTEDVACDDGAGTDAVGVDVAGVAADAIQQSLDDALRVMQAAGHTSKPQVVAIRGRNHDAITRHRCWLPSSHRGSSAATHREPSEPTR